MRKRVFTLNLDRNQSQMENQHVTREKTPKMLNLFFYKTFETKNCAVVSQV